ncbi:unnamed protein product [Prunus brigantina]
MTENEDPEKKGGVWALDQQLDQPMDEEAKKFSNMSEDKKCSSITVLQLAFQSLGVVYGDLGTSPLYVFYNTFPYGIDDPDDLLGALSVVIYSLTLIALVKYVLIVCRANDNGQGGTFALYSLLCRHAKIKTVPNQDQSDEELTTFSRSTFGEKSFAASTKRWLEGHALIQNVLLILVLIGSCMVIGDGILTPAISVLSAVGGINCCRSHTSNDIVVVVAVVILVILFIMQQFGTQKFGWLFAPIVLLWFLLIGGIGIFNIWKYDTSILRAFSPVYVIAFFRKGGTHGWASLGGIMLCINGTETLFADVSHFPVLSVQIAFTLVAFPCLLLAYSGQAAYLMKYPHHVFGAFYYSIPESIYWPVFSVATAAAIVASQATITATFSLIKQALALGCFPRVKVVYTSRSHHQIYIPDINWILMILCISVTAGFKNQSQIGNAAVMILVWRCHWTLVLIFACLTLVVEGTYFSAVLLKVNQGGWVPLVIAVAFFIVMYGWHYGTVIRFDIEMHSKVSMAWILGLGPSLGLVRVPGIGLVYSEIATGVPRIFSHFITNLPAIHSVVVFVCVKYLPVCTVPEEERFLVKRIGPNNFHISIPYSSADLSITSVDSIELADSPIYVSQPLTCSIPTSSQLVEIDEIEFLNRCRDAGVVHILGNTVVRTRRDSNCFKKIAVDYLYAFLRKICTSPLYVFYNTFPDGIGDPEDLIGALSVIIYSLTLIPLLKYVFIVCRANDNGQGGTFALYSLLCRHAKIKAIPNQDQTDEALTTYSRSTFGTEALFADLSHFPVPSIQIAFTSVVFPCLLLAYCGQAAYLMKNSNNVIGAFYHSIPDSIYWPVFIVATAAAIVASQATITATFSLIKQALALGCFPRVKVVHTSRKYRHQIYIPEINWIVMILCIAVTAGFKNQNQIGNASGTAVCIVMLVTTLLMILVMILVWRCHWILVLIFTGLSLVVEGTYFSAVLLKVNQGGWVPLVIAAAFFVIMYVWHYGTVKRFEIEMHSKVSMAWILGLGPSLGLVRVPGIGLVYSELANGVPRIFSHFITNLPAIHSVVVFVCVKYLPVCTVPEEERFLVKRIGPKNFHMFRCVARYGYKDDHKKDDDFEKKLFQSLFMFVRLESLMEASSDSDVSSLLEQQTKQSEDGLFCNSSNILHSDVDLSIASVDSIVPDDSPLHSNNMTSFVPASSEVETDEIEFLNHCRDAGVVHMLGNTVVRARRESKFWKKIAIDYLYAFLRKICRENSVMFNVPHESLLNVGQVFYV